MLMGQKYRVPRSVVIERVRQLSGVDITVLGTEPDIQRAMAVLTNIKESGLAATTPPPAG